MRIVLIASLLTHMPNFVDPSETILYSFRMSARWLIFSALLIIFLFGGLAYFFLKIPVFFYGILILLSVFLLGLLVYYFSILYVVTNKKIYKSSGFPWREVLSARHGEITDIAVVQGIFQRIFLNMGTIEINTSGSIGYEIIMIRVSDPFGRRKDIYQMVAKCKNL